jgi:hypothetical protein
MRSDSRRLTLALLIALPLAIGACASSPTGTPPTSPTSAAASEPAASTPAIPTEVPGGASNEPVPSPTAATTTQTGWGTILDAVPDSFPVYPGALAAGAQPEPVSGAYISDAAVDTVATWYRDALEGLGFSTLDLSSPLEDGSRVLDSQGDLPECRIQVTFRPAGGSTMITVLYAAACAGGEG